MSQKTILSTLCYLRDSDKTLMLNRNKKSGDVHLGKWNGLGGKFEIGETPEQCVIREVKEESGLTIDNPKLKGLLTFPNFKAGEDWYVFLFIANTFSGELIDCAEGELSWVENSKLLDLPLWEGDKIFLPLLDQDQIFSGCFVYQDKKLIKHWVHLY